MYTAALVLGAVLAVAAVLFVARPFLRRPVATHDALDEPGPLERRRLELEEERDRALAALKELEFDHRTGKVSDEDYRELVGPLRARAAEALRALERAVYTRETPGNGRRMTVAVQPPLPPEPAPEPLTPPAPPTIPEPTPVPSEPPGPPHVPEPTPVPHEPPLPGGPDSP
jgi:hypothetical protein